jgi:hypothetical protein
MNAKIDQLTPAEHEWIAEQIDATKLFVAETVGTVQNELPSPEDLDQAFGSWLKTHDPAEANSVINCVGVAFGQHLVNTTPLEWVIASDEYGTELAVYGLPGNGDILIYPQNFVTKRYEKGVGGFIKESINQIQRQVADVEKGGSGKKWWKPW